MTKIATQNKTKGMFYKAAKIAKNAVTDEDMQMINKYALAPLEPADVFSFKVTMAANQVDRDHEVFPVKTLEKLQEMFVGKTVVKDHDPRSDNQIARIYATYLQQDADSITPAGEAYTQLIAKCYMVKTASNADLIAEISAGIRKEVSLGCRISKAVCSICETDNVQSYCKHFPGQTYDGKTCFFKLEGPKDAYELSFVAVPAQREAGTVKSYGNEPVSFEEMQAAEQVEKTVEADGIEQHAVKSEHAVAEVQQAIDLARNSVSEERLAMIYEAVKTLADKMDSFLTMVAENNKETRSNETADFSDVLDLAEDIEDAQVCAQVSKVDPGEDLAEVLLDAQPDAPDDLSKADEGSQISENSEVSQGSEKAFEDERLALARLRSLDLSINLFSK